MTDEHAQKVSFYLKRTVGERLVDLARAGDRTLSAEIRRACREHVQGHSDFASVPLRQAKPDEHHGRTAAPSPAAARGGDA